MLSRIARSFDQHRAFVAGGRMLLMVALIVPLMISSLSAPLPTPPDLDTSAVLNDFTLPDSTDAPSFHQSRRSCWTLLTRRRARYSTHPSCHPANRHAPQSAYRLSHIRRLPRLLRPRHYQRRRRNSSSPT